MVRQLSGLRNQCQISHRFVGHLIRNRRLVGHFKRPGLHFVFPRPRISYWRDAHGAERIDESERRLFLDVLELHHIRCFRMCLSCDWSWHGVLIACVPFKKVLSMRKRIKVIGFSDWDTMFYNNLLSIPVLAVFSLLVEDWSTANLTKNL